MFKKIFRGERDAPAADEASTIEDLIVLERYDEAVSRLKARLRENPDDLHGHLRLAEAYVGLKEHSRAVDEYVYVAEEYAQDGFYDRGLALLMKAKRYAPLDQGLDEKIERFRLAKDSERTRILVIEGLRARSGGATAAVLVERLWHKVAPSPLARNLGPQVLKRLFSVMELVSWKAGDRIASQGDGEDEPRLYFLLDGVVRVRIPGNDGPAAVIRDFGPGDVIGETVLLERRSWPADYEAAEPSRALALGREGLEKALVGNADPRGFLTALRMQHHDRDVTKNLARITGT
ncbi:MAG: cyclic nucleotide-binding domain-containing protein [Acidobacteriota bacterium]